MASPSAASSCVDPDEPLDVTFMSKRASKLTDTEVLGMTNLFSTQYGRWGSSGPVPGKAVRMSTQRLRSDFLADDSTTAVVAKVGDRLVGQAICMHFDFAGGKGVWVTQLVVDESVRSQRVATRMLSLAFAGVRGLRVCAMASSNPYAVRAMENAVGARCTPATAALVAEEVIDACGVAYVTGKRRRITQDPPTSIIDTEFFVDHAGVDKARAEMADWQLGELREGEEYLAIAMCPLASSAS